MNIKQLEYFVDLSETLNFTKTAQISILVKLLLPNKFNV